MGRPTSRRAPNGSLPRFEIVRNRIGWRIASNLVFGTASLALVHVPLRVAASLGIGPYALMLDISGALWAAALVLFLTIYGPMLWRPRAGNAANHSRNQQPHWTSGGKCSVLRRGCDAASPAFE